MPIKHYIDHGNGEVKEVEKAEFDQNLHKTRVAKGLEPAPQTKTETKKATDIK